MRTLSTALGLLLWLLSVALLDLEPVARLLLGGPLVAVPLVLGLVRPRSVSSGGWRRWRVAEIAQPIAAVLLVVSFALDRGWLAGAFALPWAAFTGWLAVLGGLRLAERGLRGPVAEIAVDSGLIFPIIGGAWLVVSRLGVPFLGFGEPIVILTAAHFHFAGCVLPVVAGLAVRARPTGLARASAIGIVGGVPLLAVGITASQHHGARWLEVVAALWLSAAVLLVSVFQLGLIGRVRRWSQRALLVVASLSLAAAMILAIAYAVGFFIGARWLDIPTMVRTHAVLNVLGFAIPVLVFWNRLSATERRALRFDDTRHGLCICLRGVDRPPERGAWDGLAFAGERARDDAIDEHVATVGAESPGSPEHGGPFERIAGAIARFDVFPLARLRPLAPVDGVAPGDIIVCATPFAWIFDVVIASRVTAVHDERRGDIVVSGFTYRTLEGHPFVGEETFLAEKDVATGEVRMRIRARSRAAVPIVRALRPWVRRAQRRAGREAVTRHGRSPASLTESSAPPLQRADSRSPRDRTP